MRTFFFILALTHFSFADLRKKMEPFLEQHCYACHDDFDQEADLNILDLKFSPEDDTNRALWEKIFHRVETGEMPPKKKKRPAPADLASFLETLEAPLLQVDKDLLSKSGRVNARRLTTLEYENSVHDLLGIDLPLAHELTADAEEGFATQAASQQISHFHLNNYLRVADLALAEAFDRALDGDEKFHRKLSAKEIASPGRGNDRGPQFWKNKAISWSSRMQFAGRITKSRVPETGWYRVTLHDFDAINPGPDGVLWASLQTGSGYSNEPLLFPVGPIEATEKPSTRSFQAWIKKDHILIIKPDEGGLKSIPQKGGSFRFKKQDFGKQGFVGFRMNKITLERIYPHATRSKVRKNLFDQLDPKQPGPTPKASLARLIDRFAARAFRRPLAAAELVPYHQLAHQYLDSGHTFSEALRTAYHAILCSPNFLTFVEKPGPLDDHAIATRLSYLLWKTLPDDSLRRLADQGKLRDPKILHQQITRLLNHEKSARFIQDFTDQWLDLREINATQPDPRRFRNFDLPLQMSMLAETRAFVSALIKEDRPVTHLLKSDIGFLNTRLQSHYGLAKVPVTPGGGLQKVSLNGPARSGLLTQGAILKVTADGSVTSPVLRGVWVNERILGRHIAPPPPNIPAVEPDIRGAVSIRDQLAKHTNSITCASCHDKIDPSGFALESYDPIGQFRTAYGKKKSSAKVDPSGITPDGQTFPGFSGWRDIYLRQPKVLARSFAIQILSYGIGADLRFSDRPHLKKILAQSKTKNYGLRTLIHFALTSEIFLTK